VPFTVGEFALGLEGLALLRAGPFASDERLAARVAELVGVAGALDHDGFAAPAFGPEADVLDGYARWAPVYERPNPLVMVEEPVVRAALDAWPRPRRVLDAACGTGRHAEYLTALGHTVTGLDVSPDMLALARRRVPGARLVEAPLAPLPFEDAEFDAAVCALALSHVADPSDAIAELARVVRPGGPVVVSDFHPFMVLIGGQGGFRTEDGTPGFVTSYAHLTGATLAAFARAGLTVRGCDEPTWTLDAARVSFPGITDRLYEEAIAGLPLSIVWQLARH
jgi:ubiquinone/menaquinone biosynthesis C-methylase UbiE